MLVIGQGVRAQKFGIPAAACPDIAHADERLGFHGGDGAHEIVRGGFDAMTSTALLDFPPSRQSFNRTPA